MKVFSLLLFIFFMLFSLQGCYYGEETLKVVNSETISLVEQPNGRKAESILISHEEDSWFFIPQVLLLPHSGNAWLAVRIYSQAPLLNYEIIDSQVSFDNEEVVGVNFIEPEGNEWFPTVRGWSYQVVRVKSYSYETLLSLEMDSAKARFEISVGDEVKSRTFDLDVKKVRRSGW